MNTWIVWMPDKEAFYSSLNTELITDVDYRHAKRIFKNFNNKNLGDYHDLYVQSDTLLLGDIFENFRNKCIEISGLDPTHFLSAPGLAWQEFLKKTRIRGIRGRTYHAIHRYTDANNK